MSLSVPQNGVKSDNEPVIELFVKVRQYSAVKSTEELGCLCIIVLNTHTHDHTCVVFNPVILSHCSPA